MSIEHIGPSSPDDKKMYKQEYKKGADLFQKAVDKYDTANSPYKKEAFRRVMDEAMDVMDKAAYALNNEMLKQQNKKIHEDLAAYEKGGKPDTLKVDLEQAKRSV